MTVTILPGQSSDSPNPPRHARSVPRRHLAVAAVAVLLLVAAGGWLFTRHGSHKPAAARTSHPAAATLSPSALYHAALAAAASQRSVHVQGTFGGSGHRVALNDDDASTSGIQRITADGHHAEVRVVGSATYFRADDSALHGYFGLSSSLVKRYHGRWVKLVHGNDNYDAVTAAITLSSALKEVVVQPPFSAVPTKVVDGVPSVGIRGHLTAPGSTITASVVLWVATAAPHLPVAYDATAAGLTDSMTFTRWNEAVTVKAPAAWVTPPRPTAGQSPATDAAMRSDLRNMATYEETYVTDNVVYATAAQLRRAYPQLRLARNDRVVVHLAGQQGYCMAGHMTAHRWWIYSSLDGGLSGPATHDTCNTATFPTYGGILG